VYTRTYTHALVHTHTHSCTHTPHTQIHTHIHTTHTHTHAHTAHTHTHTHTHKHLHTNTGAYDNTHTLGRTNTFMVHMCMCTQSTLCTTIHRIAPSAVHADIHYAQLLQKDWILTRAAQSLVQRSSRSAECASLSHHATLQGLRSSQANQMALVGTFHPAVAVH